MSPKALLPGLVTSAAETISKGNRSRDNQPACEIAVHGMGVLSARLEVLHFLARAVELTYFSEPATCSLSSNKSMIEHEGFLPPSQAFVIWTSRTSIL